MSTDVNRGYVNGPGGQVHYRRSGTQGPFLILLHPTPVSSVAFERALPLLGRSLQAIAIDTPGYGMSDRPPVPSPGIEDYVRQIIAAVDGLGIENFALYGSHTGSAVAIALHNAIPHRITHLAMSGVPILNEDEIGFFFRNLGEPAMEPDGGHLVRMWKSLGNLAPDPTVLDQLQMASSQAISIYDHYLDGLRAVSRFDMRAAAKNIRRPVFILSAEFDRLAAQVNRLSELNPETTVKIVPGAHPQLPWTNPAIFADEIATYVTGTAPSQRTA
jgi:pimeloyl-ACP methyl ester carboxylesterase